MKQLNFPAFGLLLLLMVSASSCEVVGGIFKVGMWTGVLIVVLIVGLVLWLIGKTRRRR
jgi:hypothetical protein